MLLNIVTALPSEARPLIDHFKLRREEASRLPVYASSRIRLAVSGIGKAACANATGFLAGSTPPGVHQAWLNIGIAGHAHAPPGTVGLAHQIDDAATGRSYYPGIVFRSPCPSYRVKCFDRPTTTYDGDAMCDMESSAYFAAATRYSDVETVHAIKIVSDNSAAHIATIDRQRIHELIGQHVDVVDDICEQLLQVLGSTVPADPGRENIDRLTRQWRFSVTQIIQLRELSRRWSLLRPAEPWPPLPLDGCRSARDVIHTITSAVDTCALEIS